MTPEYIRTALFVGGIADGQCRNDPAAPYWEITESLYRRELLRSGGEEWVFYVEDGLTTAQAISRILSGYNPSR